MPSNSAEWLFSLQRFGIQPGLDNIKGLLADLGNPQEQFSTILVGGTNGKGSTSFSLAHLLARHECVALFTSPHLTRLSERFLVSHDGTFNELPLNLVLETLSEIREAAEHRNASFFEVVTALGCLLFARQGITKAVMEVGLGGRWDATNALDPILSIISNIDLDHTHILGETHEAIAAEKSGILRPGRPAVTCVQPELLPILEQEQADLWAMNRDWSIHSQNHSWEGSKLHISIDNVSFSCQTPLLGEHGRKNAALAAVSAYRLGISEKDIAQTIIPQWPGRLEKIGSLLLDGAHNPAGARATKATLAELGIERLPLIFGAADDKDISEMTSILQTIASDVIVTRAALSPRAADPNKLADFFQGSVICTETPQEALTAFEQIGAPLGLACGSLYLIGELRPLLLGEQAEQHLRWQ